MSQLRAREPLGCSTAGTAHEASKPGAESARNTEKNSDSPFPQVQTVNQQWNSLCKQ